MQRPATTGDPGLSPAHLPAHPCTPPPLHVARPTARCAVHGLSRREGPDVGAAAGTTPGCPPELGVPGPSRAGPLECCGVSGPPTGSSGVLQTLGGGTDSGGGVKVPGSGHWWAGGGGACRSPRWVQSIGASARGWAQSSCLWGRSRPRTVQGLPFLTGHPTPTRRSDPGVKACG